MNVIFLHVAELAQGLKIYMYEVKISLGSNTEADFMNILVHFVEVSGHILESFLILEVSVWIS